MNDINFEYDKNGLEKIPTCIFPDSKIASIKIAQEIAKIIKTKAELGETCVLGLATGSSPIFIYKELVRLHKEENLSFKNVVTFNLDEYYPMQPQSVQSYVRFMNENLFDHIDINKEHIFIPDGTINKKDVLAYCTNYENKIKDFGGIDIQILGIGRTGHIGFNEPGSGINSSTRMITLDHITITDASSKFFGYENVPIKAITMGIKTILNAKKIFIMAWGEAKAQIVKEAIEGKISELIPATYLQTHKDVILFLDQGASSELSRIKTPWITGSIEWNEQLVKKAVIWLSLKLEKPILKLTNRDYADHSMLDLITEYDSAYNINIRVFKSIQKTITGYPEGKDNIKKRAIIFSPHPDDDVISMGGTFIRLVDHNNDVHVAYQTSGSIAVSDEDVLKFIDFTSAFTAFFENKQNDFIEKLKNEIKTKKPTDLDSLELQKIKALIRKNEAKAACRYVGIDEKNAHFLEMPFYETGTVKKKPLSEEDIKIIVDFLNEYKPDQIFAAGDLSDPHGTHMVCLNAIFSALDRIVESKEEWIKKCRVWLYRGAWQEWDIEDIDMAIPLSPDELMRKRRAIFKHQSQKDQPLFPGNDSREFWQRSEARNRGTAIVFDKLGLPEYEAIEAFKEYFFIKN
ncbi:MAG: glucosamine-6-phosphate deaminase [Candidatus Sericytochromatia bacterium]